MYNYSKLLGRIREKGLTHAEFAQKIGISEWTLLAKLKNKSQFKQGEMEKSAEVLEFPILELPNYFFCH